MSKYRIINNRGYKLDYKKVVFSDGTSIINLIVDDNYINSNVITITIPSSITKFDDVLWDLLLLKDVLLHRFRKSLETINLNFEYLPHARAARRIKAVLADPVKCFNFMEYTATALAKTEPEVFLKSEYHDLLKELCV